MFTTHKQPKIGKVEEKEEPQDTEEVKYALLQERKSMKKGVDVLLQF